MLGRRKFTRHTFQPGCACSMPVLMEQAPLARALAPFYRCYNYPMQRKVFWMSFVVLGLIADLVLPFWWALAATVPIGVASWWIAYRSEWF